VQDDQRIRIFLAGIIQGSIPGRAIHRQDYREPIKRILRTAFPAAEILCPVENHPHSLEYGPERGHQVFFDHIEQASSCDLVVAFLPEASMGTAVEMFAAHQSGRVVVTISPLRENWAVRFLSSWVCRDLEEFEAAAARGEIHRLLVRSRAECCEPKP
jgi:hypothetical protein